MSLGGAPAGAAGFGTVDARPHHTPTRTPGAVFLELALHPSGRIMPADHPAPPAGNPAADLFRLGINRYLDTHAGKKWRDPTAAIRYRHPGLGTWVRGRVTRMGGGQGTTSDQNGDLILAGLGRDTLWDGFRTRT